ncbi:hypothetical protein [Bacillus pseudomycoides]|uniref:hypothetical protein n=1 Tax=Bacillus pseudomycoides TaxID=64104 RepID=UPI001FB3EA8F|nr:hypothetical protein [Bacillus pseudomycoides]
MHIYDDIGWSTGGASAINIINSYLVEKIYDSINWSNRKAPKVLIYFPEKNSKGFGIVTYGYLEEGNKYESGLPLDENTTYEPFINMAKRSTL